MTGWKDPDENNASLALTHRAECGNIKAMLLGTGSETFYLLPHYHRIHHDSAQKCRSMTRRSPSHHNAETLPNTEVRLQGDEVPVVEGGGGVMGW